MPSKDRNFSAGQQVTVRIVFPPPTLLCGPEWGLCQGKHSEAVVCISWVSA